MKSKAAIDFLILLESKKEYYENYKDVEVRNEQEYELAEKVIKSFEHIILQFAEALAK